MFLLFLCLLWASCFCTSFPKYKTTAQRFGCDFVIHESNQWFLIVQRKPHAVRVFFLRPQKIMQPKIFAKKTQNFQKLYCFDTLFCLLCSLFVILNGFSPKMTKNLQTWAARLKAISATENTEQRTCSCIPPVHVGCFLLLVSLWCCRRSHLNHLGE